MSSIPQNVDVVFTWVESTPQHQAARRKFTEAGTDGDVTRFEDHDELKYAIRSVYKFAPWVRNIFVVCDDSQRPSWLNVDAPIVIVPHSQLYGQWASMCLPTFNSQSIECHLHKIPGLAEHFIYFNDDMFLGKKCTVSDFFDPAGRPLYGFRGLITPGNTQHQRAWMNNLVILRGLGHLKSTGPYPLHQATPLLKSSFFKAWEDATIRPYLEITSASRFRKKDNIYLIGLLVYLNVFQGLARAISRRSHKYITITPNVHANEAMYKQVQKLRPHQFCLNDGAGGSNRQSVHARTRAFLKSYFPFPVVRVEDDSHTHSDEKDAA